MKNFLKGTKWLVLWAIFILSSCATPNKVACPTFEASKPKKNKYASSHHKFGGLFSFQKSEKAKGKASIVPVERKGPSKNLEELEPSITASHELEFSLLPSTSDVNLSSDPELQPRRAVDQPAGKKKRAQKLRRPAKTSLEKEVTRNHSLRKSRALSQQSPEDDEKQKSKRKAALIKGGSILLMAILAGISIPVLGTLSASIGLVAILLLDILITLGINSYYKKRKPKLAKTSSFLRLLYSAIFGIGIGYHIAGNVAMFTSFWQWGLIGFGLHLITLGFLFNNEGGKKWVNTAIKSLLIVAGIGYMIINIGILLVPNPVAFAALMEAIFIAPMILGEVSFAFWMIFKGGKKVQNEK